MIKTIFLLGAGASVDAGMPTVAELTKKLRDLLPHCRDVNGSVRPEFGEVFDYVKNHDPSVAEDYERFFEWIKLLLDAAKEPFRKIVQINMPISLSEAMFHLPFVLGEAIARTLETYPTEPSYLERLRDFVPAGGRLKVFSLNYDCCVEDACAPAGIEVITGFDAGTKRWNPSLFETNTTGINLYKIHGSLRWFLVIDRNLLDQGILENQSHYYLELKPEDHVTASNLDVDQKPELVLGPGTKIQVDDPFLTLFYEFHKSIKESKICVVMGYGYRDPHVNKKLDEALEAGASILDVNPGSPCTSYLANSRYHFLRASAKRALTEGLILSELQKLVQ